MIEVLIKKLKTSWKLKCLKKRMLEKEKADFFPSRSHVRTKGGGHWEEAGALHSATTTEEDCCWLFREAEIRRTVERWD